VIEDAVMMTGGEAAVRGDAKEDIALVEGRGKRLCVKFCRRRRGRGDGVERVVGGDSWWGASFRAGR
jgi:hypothetical protein